MLIFTQVHSGDQADLPQEYIEYSFTRTSFRVKFCQLIIR